MKKRDIQTHLYNLIIPKVILVSFEIENIKETEEYAGNTINIFFHLEQPSSML